MSAEPIKGLVLAGFGINCDYESQYALEAVGVATDRVHINEVIARKQQGRGLEEYHILVVDGGFAWADDHGAGVILGLKLRAYLGEDIERFIRDGKLIIGICNGFQALVNMGLLPGFDDDYQARKVALAANDCGNFRDQWVHLAVEQQSPCVFTKGIENLELPVRHGEGKFYADPDVIERLENDGLIVMRYGRAVPKPYRRGNPNLLPPAPDIEPAGGAFPMNPNGSVNDIAGICDPSGRVFGLMPHPEAFQHLTRHPEWTRRIDHPKRWNQALPDWEGDGLKIFHNAAGYLREHFG